MTFEEYKDKNGIEPSYYVRITEKDCKIISYVGGGSYVITLEIVEEEWNYLLTKHSTIPYMNSNVLYTMDEDGNRKAQSCFIWTEEVLKNKTIM